MSADMTDEKRIQLLFQTAMDAEKQVQELYDERDRLRAVLREIEGECERYREEASKAGPYGGYDETACDRIATLARSALQSKGT